MSRPWLLPILAFLILGVVFFINEAAPSSPESSEEAWLTIDFGNGRVRAFRGVVIPQMNARVALLAAAESAGFEVVFDPQTGEVRAINGSDGRWEVAKEGDGISSVPATISVAAGDRLLLRRLP